MTESAYARLLGVARDQARALERGDLDAAVALLPVRAEIMRTIPDAKASDAEAIREILSLDRRLSSGIRERMIGIRNEVVAGQHGRAALSGYRPPLRRAARAIDAAG